MQYDIQSILREFAAQRKILQELSLFVKKWVKCIDSNLFKKQLEKLDSIVFFAMSSTPVILTPHILMSN